MFIFYLLLEFFALSSTLIDAHFMRFFYLWWIYFFLLDDIELQFSSTNVRIHNKQFDTLPIVIHGNGPTKDFHNHLTNYISNGWTFTEGCMSCKEDTYLLTDVKVCVAFILYHFLLSI